MATVVVVQRVAAMAAAEQQAVRVATAPGLGLDSHPAASAAVPEEASPPAVYRAVFHPAVPKAEPMAQQAALAVDKRYGRIVISVLLVSSDFPT